MVKMVTATEVKNRFGDIIKGAYLRDEHLIVKRGGIPVVAIISIQDYTKLVSSANLPQEIAQEIATAAKTGEALARFQAFLQSVHRKLPAIPDEETEKDIEEAITAVRSQAE